jgi:hypothetical protein
MMLVQARRSGWGTFTRRQLRASQAEQGCSSTCRSSASSCCPWLCSPCMSSSVSTATAHTGMYLCVTACLSTQLSQCRVHHLAPASRLLLSYCNKSITATSTSTYTCLFFPQPQKQDFLKRGNTHGCRPIEKVHTVIHMLRVVLSLVRCSEVSVMLKSNLQV